MSKTPEDDLFARQLDTLRSGVRIMALRALADADLADEVVQETVARVLSAVQDGRVQSPENLGPFTRGVARHVIADLIREGRRRRNLEALEGAPGDALIVREDALDTLVRSDAEERVRQALSRLSPTDQELLRMTYFEGLKPAKIAERVGEPVTRIRMRKSRALERLRRAFTEATATRYKTRAVPTNEEEGQSTPPTGAEGAQPKTC